jgi:hypothetical protein
MKKIRLITYWITLAMLMILYYGIADSLYSTTQIDFKGGAMVGLQLIAFFIAPVVLVLGFVRQVLLITVNRGFRLFDVSYFVIPLLIMIACFAAELWPGIILSVLAGLMIAYEFIESCYKNVFFVGGKK